MGSEISLLSVNNKGQVVGNSDLPGDTADHAFLWTKETGMQDLGTLPGDVLSVGLSINDSGDVVGVSLDAKFNLRAYLWQNGAMTDLNTLIPADSSLYLLLACNINSRGEIVGLGVNSTGEAHAYLAAPRNGEASSESLSPAAQGVPSPRVLSEDARRLLQQRLTFGRFGARVMAPR
jgi:probable HAF family extracellular repeat protein